MPLLSLWNVYLISHKDELIGRVNNVMKVIKENGFTSPIVKSSSEHKHPLRFGEVATVKTIFIDSPAAKMVFRYEIYNEAKEVVCTGQTTQVFLGNDDELFLNLPPFFEEWKKKVGLLK